MKLLFCSLLAVSAFAQKPTNAALMIPQNAPELDYVAVANPLPLPAGVTIGAPASVGFDSKGYMLLLNRGPQAFVEFEPNGQFCGLMGEGLLHPADGRGIEKGGTVGVRARAVKNDGMVRTASTEEGCPAAAGTCLTVRRTGSFTHRRTTRVASAIRIPALM